jgi:hypothetical protein
MIVITHLTKISHNIWPWLRSNLGQKPKNIAKSLKIFFCRTICARGEQKAVSLFLKFIWGIFLWPIFSDYYFLGLYVFNLIYKVGRKLILMCFCIVCQKYRNIPQRRCRRQVDPFWPLHTSCACLLKKIGVHDTPTL